MKIRENFLLRRVAGNWVVVAVDEACIDFDGMLTLNESGATLWRRMEQGARREELVAALLAEYEVTEELAAADVDAFLASVREVGCLADDATD